VKRPTLVIASIIRRWPHVMVGAALCAAVALSFGIPRLKFQTGQETLLDPSSKIARDNGRFQAQFGGDPLLILFETPPGGATIEQLFTKQNRESLARLDSDLEASGNFHSIISPLTILEFAKTQIEQRTISQPVKLASDEAKAAAEARAASASRGEPVAQRDVAAAAARQKVDDEFNAAFGADAKRLIDAGDHTFDNQPFLHFVLYGADGKLRPDIQGVFPDDHHALMVIRMKGNLSIDDGSRVAGNVKSDISAYHFDGVAPLVSGPPLLVKEINDKMRSALVVMAIFAVAIMVTVLFAIFRARWRLLSLPAVLIGCVSAFGLMGFVGIPLTMVTISGLPILIGLGVDFAIQLHSRIEEETFAAESAEVGLDRTLARLGPALAVAGIAACFGFIVLHLSDVPMIRDFGSMLAVGAVIVFITSLTLISSVLYLRERTRLGPRELPGTRFEVERIVTGLTAHTVGRLAPIALVALLVSLGGLYVSRKIPTQTDAERFIPSGSSVLRDLHHVRDVAGSTSELNLLVEVPPGSHVTDQNVLDWMLAFEDRERAAHARDLSQSNSLASLTKSVTGDAPTSASTEQALGVVPRALADNVVNSDRTMASITFALSANLTLDAERTLTDDIERDAHPPAGVTIAPAGLSVVGTAAIDAVSGNRELMSFVALAAIFATLLVWFRSPVKAVAPLMPVVLALGASAMLLYVAGVEYSPLTSISGPLIIAMGTEFNVLLMTRYFEERAGGLEARPAMAKASLRIGRAIAASGLTVMGGFAVLAFSDFPLLDNFGKVTALNIGLSLLSTLILLPPLLVWADEDHHLVSTSTDVVPE
jgi:hydrophobe/amphiphile efflux-3 (HAE3) family protein